MPLKMLALLGLVLAASTEATAQGLPFDRTGNAALAPPTQAELQYRDGEPETQTPPRSIDESAPPRQALDPRIAPPHPSILTDGDTFPRLWLKAEALYWWTSSSPLPVPLVTAGSLADPVPGAIGQPGTSVLIGNQSIKLPGRPGGRFTMGFALDTDGTWGAEGSYLVLARRSVSQSVFSDGSPASAALAFPFYDPTIPGENSSSIANPGVFAGTAMSTLTTSFQGVELNVLHTIDSSPGLRWDVLGGFRYLNLQESLSFLTDSPNVPPNVPFDFQTFDRINARNNFYGAQIGGRVSLENDRLFLNATGKLALGGTVESVGVNGGTFTSDAWGYTFPGGYLAQPSNIGSQRHSHFAVAPEVGLNVGVRFTPWASLIMGYSFLYVSSVARPGDQIDRVINPTQSYAISGGKTGGLVGPARPELMIHDTDFWVQGLNFGLEFRF